MRVLWLALAVSAVFAQSPADLDSAIERTLERQAKPLNDPEVTAYIEHILSSLAAPDFKLKLIDTGVLSATALPGRILILSSGAILRCASEAELAALLAHQVGHMLVKHDSTGAPVPFLGAPFGLCMRTQSVPAIPVGYQKRAAQLESEADSLALARLRDAGYDPEALHTVFVKWTTSYPAAEARAETDALVNTSEFDRIKARLAPLQPPRKRPSLIVNRAPAR